MADTARQPLPRNANFALLLWKAPTAGDDHVAIEQRGQAVSYGALKSRAAAVATTVSASGARAGDRVAIFLERGADAAAAYFGVLAAGCAAIIVNHTLRPRQLEYVLKHSGAAMLLTSGRELDRQPRALETTVQTILVEGIAQTGEFGPEQRMQGDIAQIIYTSGSTGLPKGVAFAHRALWADLAAVLEYLELLPTDRTISLLPFSGVYGLNQLICTVATGGTLVVESSPLGAEIVRTMREGEVTVAAAVPPLWSNLLGTGGLADGAIPSLRVLQNAGGHLPVPLVRQLRAAQPHARLFLQYGMTEVFRTSFLPPEEVDAHPDSMGRAIPGTEVLVLREDLTACEPEEVGELVHRGPTVAMGYWNDPELTEKTFRPNPLRGPGVPATERVVFSGDMVRRDRDGYLHFVSRRDHLIKTLGYRVGPDEIVDVLCASGQIREAAITTEPDLRRGDRIIAHVVLTDGGSLRQLRNYARLELPTYMQPASYTVRASIPRLPSGKYAFDVLRGGAAAVRNAPA